MPRQTRSRSRSSSEMEEGGLDKYNHLLRTTTPTLQEEAEDEQAPWVTERIKGGWNDFQRQQKSINKNLTRTEIAQLWKSKTDQEKLEYGNKQQQEQKKKNVSVKIRGSTNKFVDALERLGPKSRKILEDTPFHDLLLMDWNIQDNVLIKHLAAKFNTQDCSIQLGDGQRLVLTAQHVTDILGIEDGEDEDEIKINKQGQSAPDLTSKLRKDFLDETGSLCITQIKSKLEGKDEDNIKRAYVLLACHYIVYPPSDKILPTSLLELVDDVGALNKKRWATFVIDGLVKGIEKYRKRKATANTEVPLGGCVLLLQLFATKGSITTPMKRDKRRKKMCDKDCGDSSKTTQRPSIERIKELFHEANKGQMDDTKKRRDKSFKKYKKNPFELKFMEHFYSQAMSNLEKSSINCENYMKELQDIQGG